MTATLGWVSWHGSGEDARDRRTAGISAMGGFAPFGADELSREGAWAWSARSHRGMQLAEASGLVLALDGRLRRPEDFRRRWYVASWRSDADAMLSVYQLVGARLFEDLDADAAVVVIDSRNRTVQMFRDLLGERGLRWALRGDRLYFGSRGTAILACLNEPMRPTAAALAHFAAFAAPPDDCAWAEGICELPPGSLLTWTEGAPPRITASVPALSADLRFSSDQDAREQWRSVLEDAVCRAVADDAAPAVMLSGGIDSTLLAASLRGQRATAVSWAVPGFPSCDESGIATASAASLELPHVVVPGDDLLPLAQPASWPIEDEAPLANPYRRLNQAVFGAARRSGARVMLSGNFGDHLYPDPRHWIRSLFRERGAGAVLGALRDQWREQGAMAVMRDSGWRGLVRGRNRRRMPDWLTPDAARYLRHRANESIDQVRVDHAYGRSVNQDAELARRFSIAHGVELRFPYRDPALLRFVLGLPMHYLSAPRGAKWLSRELLQGRVPEAVRLRPKSGSLAPFFRAGVLGAPGEAVRESLWSPDAAWRPWIRESSLRDAFAHPRHGRHLLLIWTAMSMHLWIQAHRRGSAYPLASRILQSEVAAYD